MLSHKALIWVLKVYFLARSLFFVSTSLEKRFTQSSVCVIEIKQILRFQVVTIYKQYTMTQRNLKICGVLNKINRTFKKIFFNHLFSIIVPECPYIVFYSFSTGAIIIRKQRVSEMHRAQNTNYISLLIVFICCYIMLIFCSWYLSFTFYPSLPWSSKENSSRPHLDIRVCRVMLGVNWKYSIHAKGRNIITA